MTTIRAIIKHVEGLTGHPLNRDEGLGHGPADRRVRGATVCWMATPDAIRASGERGDDLLIGHESLYYPYNAPDAERLPEGWENWPVNHRRRTLLAQYDLTFLRIHGSADEIAIFDTFAEMLELGDPVVAEGLVKVYEIEPCSLREIISRVKQQVGMDRIRVSVPGEQEDAMDRYVHRVGLPWGGLGLFVNVGYQQKLIAEGCDVFIAGESDNYGFRFAQEAGIPMIETSHEISENPGLAVFTERLKAAFPDVDVAFYGNPCAWRVI
jgi:putative NIF3 family GTP cyclohydrolase 1 type 2